MVLRLSLLPIVKRLSVFVALPTCIVRNRYWSVQTMPPLTFSYATTYIFYLLSIYLIMRSTFLVGQEIIKPDVGMILMSSKRKNVKTVQET